jgi:ribosomal protein S18 acetylase RimI-like enzyme
MKKTTIFTLLFGVIFSAFCAKSQSFLGQEDLEQRNRQSIISMQQTAVDVGGRFESLKDWGVCSEIEANSFYFNNILIYKWSFEDLDQKIESAKKFFKQDVFSIHVEDKEISNINLIQKINKKGGELKEIQVPMYASLAKLKDLSFCSDVAQIDDKNKALAWAESTALSFGEAGSFQQFSTNIYLAKDVTLYGLFSERTVVSGLATAEIGNESVVIDYCSTHPSFRKKGLAQKLSSHVLKTLQDQGKKYVFLQATPEGFGFWNKMGFEPLNSYYYVFHFQKNEIL